MFKWILIIFVIFLSVWIFKKEMIPSKIAGSSYGRALDTLLFGLEYRIKSSSPRSKRFSGSITDIDSDRLHSLFSSVDSSGRQAVIYLYDTDCFFCRYVLSDINDLARQYSSGGVLFLVIAFEEDRDRLNFLLSKYNQLYFRPIVIAPQDIKNAAYALSKKGISFAGVPVTVYKDRKAMLYRNLTTDHATANELRSLMNSKE